MILKNFSILKLKLIFLITLLKFNIISSYKIIGPRCVPLKSKNINSNPYHPSLLSQPGAEVRYGLGIPVKLPIDPILCPKTSATPCSMILSKSESLIISDSFSISFGNTNSIIISRAKSNVTRYSDSISKSISKSIENSITGSISLTDHRSLSETIQDGIQKNFEKSVEISQTNKEDNSQINSISHQKTDSNEIISQVTLSDSKNNEISQLLSSSSATTRTRTNSESYANENTQGESVNFGVQFVIPIKKVNLKIGFNFGIEDENSNLNKNINTKSNSNSVSQGEEINEKNIDINSNSTTGGNSNSYSINNGESNSIQKSFGQSSTKDNTETDSISKSRDLLNESVFTKSKSEINTDENKNLYVINDSKDSSKSDSETFENKQNNINTSSITRTNSTKFTYITKTTQNIQFTGIKQGECKIAVCLPYVTSTSLPYECYDETDNSKKTVSVEYMFINELNNNNNNNNLCVYTLIDCIKQFDKSFQVLDNEYQKTNKNNSFQFGEIFKKNLLKMSLNEIYTLELLTDGNLVLKKRNITIWQNGMKYFENYESVRVRINEYGHLIQEVKGLFSETVPGYRNDDWITVWSTQPINHKNVTIGIARINKKQIGYKLIVSDKGILKLYDSIGVVIWSTEENSQHRFGYKFPEVYLVPTNFITPKDNDIHNSIEDNLKYRDDLKSSLFSLDKGCNSLNSNEYIQSTNGRFKLILESSGNLIIKDGNRTMWQTSTKHLTHSNEPYNLILNPVGNLMILDSINNIIWTSLTANSTNSKRPFRLELNDNGNLKIRDKMDILIWESWPLNDMNYGSTFFKKIKYHFNYCGQ